jgi:uncharacterized protein with PIN domain
VADVLDAYALVALIAGEPAEALVEEILRSGDAAITSINFGEAIDVSCRVHGLDTNAVRGVVEPLVLDGHLSVRAVDETSAWRAAQLRVGYYDRRACAISIADCFLLAAAGPDDRVATADPAVAAVAKAEAITVLPLPDSSGRRP